MKRKIVQVIIAAFVFTALGGCQVDKQQGVSQSIVANEKSTFDEGDKNTDAERTVPDKEDVNRDAVAEDIEDTEEVVIDNLEDEAESKKEPVVITQEELKNMNSVDFAKVLKFGWNLGNTLDANSKRGLESETCWYQPKTTPELIAYVKEVGFTSIRIPVSWGNHVDDEYQIDPEWMARVKEIVDYALDEDLYVIINSHHDNDFYYPSVEHHDESAKFIEVIWSQIAEGFKDYDYRLIFESMNEPRLSGTDIEWWFPVSDLKGKEAIGEICKLNQVFVDTVRASDGYNKDRFLMVPSYAANPDCTFNNAFYMPEDSADGKMMLSVHAYTPYDFAGNKDGYSDWDGSKNYEFGFMGKLKAMFINEGYGVVIGEFGATNKDNDKARASWARAYCQKAAEYGISYFVWDNGATGVGEENFGVIDRQKLKLYYPDLFEAYMTGYPD